MYIQQIFPKATSYSSRDANGLELDSLPENCAIMDNFHDDNFQDLREHYLVRMTNGDIVHLRICAAAPHSGYAAYAAILNVAKAGDDEDSVVIPFIRKKHLFNSKGSK